jgi:hypothetical protein
VSWCRALHPKGLRTTVGAAYDRRGVFLRPEGRCIGLNPAQSEMQDSRTFSLFGRFGYAIGETARLDLIVSRMITSPKRELPSGQATLATVITGRTSSVALDAMSVFAHFIYDSSGVSANG